MGKRCNLLFFLTLTILALSIAPSANAQDPNIEPMQTLTGKAVRVFIVHSYHPDFEWTKDLDAGFIQQLSKSYQVNVVDRTYLNAKLDPVNINRESESIKAKLNSSSWDLLFITDDDAMKEIGIHYLKDSKKILIFCGINRMLSYYGLGSVATADQDVALPPHIGGVLEYYPISSLLDLVKKVKPEAKFLNLFFDESETAKAVYQRFYHEFLERQKLDKTLTIRSITQSNSKKSWEKSLRATHPKTDVNLIFPFSNVRDLSEKENSQRFKSQDFAIWLTQQSKTIEFASASLTLKFPFFATVGIQGKEHGTDAAEQALLILNGKSTRKPIIGRYARLNLNQERAQQTGVKIPFEILAYSEALKQNKESK
jgi:ABC-type uncharacterized transport system substrate-binding protein